MSDIAKTVTIELPPNLWAQIEREAHRDQRSIDSECELLILTGMLANPCSKEAQAFKESQS
jgi:hypothetical protein